MATEVKLEEWGDKSEADEAAVSVWYKRSGQAVRQGDLLAEVIAQKVNLEVTAPADGVLLEITAGVGQAVAPGTVMARIGSPEEWAILSTRSAPAPFEVVPVAGGTATAAGDVVASPAAKRLLRENNLTLDEVAAFTGSSIRRIGEQEVRQYIANRATPVAVVPSSELVPYSGLRRIIGDRMSRSLHEMAQLTISSEADLTELVARREERQEVSYTALVARAVALSLPQHPYLHAALDGDNIRLHHHLNLGIAVSLDQGLVVPVIQDAGNLSVIQLTAEIRRLSELARQGSLSVADNSGGTFTISNLGAFDVDMFTPIINPPQAAILGIGRITDRAGVVNGQLAPRKLVWLSLSFDHRLVDGAPAAAFLKEVRHRLEQPDELFN